VTIPVEAGERSAWQMGGLCVLLVAATWAVYGQAAEHAFVDWDDPVGILRNPALAASGPADAVVKAFTSTLNANWIPLTVLSLQVNHALHGLEPAGYLLGNVALHTASALILFLALARMTGCVLPAFFVAALFALHPLHVESVAWASARKDALSGLFFTAALYAHARHAEKPRTGSIALVTLCGAGALLSKPTAVTLPFVLLLLDYWPLRRFGDLRTVALEKLPLFALVAAASAITFSVQTADRATTFGEVLPFTLRLAVVTESYGIYLWQSLWPVDLAYFYPHPVLVEQMALQGIALSGVAVLLLSVGAWLLRRSRPHLLVGWLWYLGMLVPVVGWVPVGAQAHADRYMYLPLVGLSVAVVFELARVAAGRRAVQVTFCMGGTAVVAVLGFLAWKQVGVWSDSIALKAHAVAVTRNNFVAHHGLGLALVRAGRLEEAAPQLERAAELNPDRPDPSLDLADLEMRRGNASAALVRYREVARRHPENARVHANLGLALARQGRRDEARTHLEQAAQLGRPRRVPPERWAGVDFALARLLEERGETEGARDHYRRGLEGQPGNDAMGRRLEALDR